MARLEAIDQCATWCAQAVYHFGGGLFLPAKTPHDVVMKLHQQVEEVLRAPTVQDKLLTLGVEPMPMSLEQFGKYFRNDVEANVKLVKAANIPPQ
jgi:tripartite-type tricarboxylate transporter receptor subunit TctC